MRRFSTHFGYFHPLGVLCADYIRRLRDRVHPVGPQQHRKGWAGLVSSRDRAGGSDTLQSSPRFECTISHLVLKVEEIIGLHFLLHDIPACLESGGIDLLTACVL